MCGGKKAQKGNYLEKILKKVNGKRKKEEEKSYFRIENNSKRKKRSTRPKHTHERYAEREGEGENIILHL